MNFYHFEYDNLMIKMINFAYDSINSLELIEYFTIFEPESQLGYLSSKNIIIQKILSKINLDYNCNHSGASLGVVTHELSRLLKYDYCINKFIEYLESSNSIDLFKNYDHIFNNNLILNTKTNSADKFVQTLFEKISELKFEWVIDNNYYFLLDVKNKIKKQI